MENTKQGYKVVRKEESNGKMFSCWVGQRRKDAEIEYKFDVWAHPLRYCGPLAVLPDLKATEVFIAANCMEDCWIAIPCQYVESDHLELWFFGGRRELSVSGTIFASKVMLTHFISANR